MNPTNIWRRSHRFDRAAVALADRHYSRQKPGSPQFMPPGSCRVLVANNSKAVFGLSFPKAEFVKHAWAGAWIVSIFRNEEAGPLASDMVREAMGERWRFKPDYNDFVAHVIFDEPQGAKPARTELGWHKRPSIFLPREYSRLTLIVTATKIERLNDISEEDAKAEGMPEPYFGDGDPPFTESAIMVSRVKQFRNLWNTLHGADAWSENPEVVALSVSVHKTNIDAMKTAA
jgi:hypothetical protein